MIEAINKKQKILDMQGSSIDIARKKKFFTKEMRQAEENLAFTLEKRLKDLLLEFREKELDTKIEINKKVLDLLK